MHSFHTSLAPGTQVDAVRALLESGANPNLQNREGDSTAHIAARNGILEVIHPYIVCSIIQIRFQDCGVMGVVSPR